MAVTVIEVSASQKQVHISGLDEAMRQNRYNTLLAKPSDWIIVDTAATDEDALKKASFWYGVLQREDRNHDRL